MHILLCANLLLILISVDSKSKSSLFKSLIKDIDFDILFIAKMIPLGDQVWIDLNKLKNIPIKLLF